MLLLVIAIGLASGYVTGDHGRHRRRVPGPRGHPLRDLPHHRPRRPAAAARAARSRSSSDGDGRPTAGRVIGSRESAATAEPRRPGAATGRALRPRPVLRLALPVLRLRGLRGAAARGPRARSGRSSTRCTPSSTCAPTRSTRVRAAGVAGRVQRSSRVYLGGGTPSLLPPDVARPHPRARARALRPRGRRGGDARGQPGPDERGDAAALRGRGRHADLATARRRSTTRLLRRLGRRHRARRRRGRRRGRARAAGIASISLDLLYDVPGQSLATGWRPLDAALDLGPDHLSLYALTLDDPGRRGADRGAGRPPADDERRPPLADRPPAADRTTTGPPPSTTMRSALLDELPAGAATRSRTGRGPATRAATTWPTGSAARTRRSGPGHTPSMGATRRWNAARLDGYVAALTPTDGHDRRSHPAARSRSTVRPPRPKPRSSGSGWTRACRSPMRCNHRWAISSAGRSPRSSWRWTANAGRNGSASRPAVGCCRTSSSVDWSDGRAAPRSATRRRHGRIRGSA